MKRCCSQSYKNIPCYEASHFACASSMDCTMAITLKKIKYDIPIQGLEIPFLVLCGDYFLLEDVVKRLRFLLGNKNIVQLDNVLITEKSLKEQAAEKKLSQLRHLMQIYHKGNTFLSPEDLSTEDTDFQFIQVLVKGWKEREMKQRTVKHIESVEKMYELQVDEENTKLEERRSKRERLLNTGILWLGVLSVSATVASVLQFIDFDNDFITTAIRLAVMVVTVIIAITIFLTLQLFGVIGKKKEDED